MTVTTFASEDIFDSRDVVARIEELDPDVAPLTEDETEERAILVAFMEEQDAADYGEAFIAEWHFEDYARELAEDLGTIDADANWPLTYIDWPAAARALQQDYTSIELEGNTFWYRS